ncbi:MAG: type II secretion system F family protein [Phycisphaerales bacterium]
MSTHTFQYAAIDANGSIVKGSIKADDRQSAFRALGQRGLKPTKLTGKGGLGARTKRSGRVSRKDVARFVHQLSVLLSARLPVTDCLTSIAEQETNARLKSIALSIASSVEAGGSLTDAFAQHERVFGRVIVETVRAAEKSGNLISVLETLGEMIEDEGEMTRAVRGALIYPACVLFAIVCAVTFLLMGVVPRFATMFQERGVDLPPITVGMMAVGNSLRAFWWAYLGGIVATLVVGHRVWRSARGRLVIDRWLHLVPRLRSVLVGLGVARFSGVFGVCLRSGLPLMESLSLGARASGRPLLERDIEAMIDRIKQGGRMSDVLPSCAYLPPFVRQLLRAGEESAQLPKMCALIARTHTRETKHTASSVAKVIEPVTVMGLTLVVLVIALGIFMPMWDMASIVS